MSEKVERFLEQILKFKVHRRPYSPWPEEIKKEAVEILKDPNSDEKKISKLTGIDLITFRRWKKKFSKDSIDSNKKLSCPKADSPKFKELKVSEGPEKPQTKELNKISFSVSVCNVDIRLESYNKENILKLAEGLLYVI